MLLTKVWILPLERAQREPASGKGRAPLGSQGRVPRRLSIGCGTESRGNAILTFLKRSHHDNANEKRLPMAEQRKLIFAGFPVINGGGQGEPGHDQDQAHPE